MAEQVTLEQWCTTHINVTSDDNHKILSTQRNQAATAAAKGCTRNKVGKFLYHLGARGSMNHNVPDKGSRGQGSTAQAQDVARGASRVAGQEFVSNSGRHCKASQPDT